MRQQMAVGASPAVVLKCFVSRRTKKKKQRKHHQLAQLIKVVNTLAILFIVITELTIFKGNQMVRLLAYRQHPLLKDESLISNYLMKVATFVCDILQNFAIDFHLFSNLNFCQTHALVLRNMKIYMF